MMSRPLSSDLHVLKFLSGEDKNPHPTNCEYRLLCSGYIQSTCVSEDPASSRFLLLNPFRWTVASHEWGRYPAHEWPLETVIQFTTYGANKRVGNVQYFYPPDDEVAHDIAALLTLLTRRLITVAGRSVISAPGMMPNDPPLVLPNPLFTNMNLRFWPRQPTVIARQYAWDKEAVAVDYNPDPKAVDGKKLERYLLALPRLKAARSLVLAARLYAQAMALVHQEPDIAYLLITMAIEAFATQAIDPAQTDEEIENSIPREFRTTMKELGATEKQVRAAMRQAVPKYGRPTFQFRAFADKYQGDYLFEKDDLFRSGVLKNWLPTKEKVKSAASEIYSQRSKFVHEGKPYPASIVLGLTAMVNSRAMQIDHENGPELPPLAWAERLAHVCILNYWLEQAELVGPSEAMVGELKKG